MPEYEIKTPNEEHHEEASRDVHQTDRVQRGYCVAHPVENYLSDKIQKYGNHLAEENSVKCYTIFVLRQSKIES